MARIGFIGHGNTGLPMAAGIPLAPGTDFSTIIRLLHG